MQVLVLYFPMDVNLEIFQTKLLWDTASNSKKKLCAFMLQGKEPWGFSFVFLNKVGR